MSIASETDSNALVRRAVVVMGKVPRPGRVKTRLTPALSPESACRLYEAILADVFDLVDRAARDSDVPIKRGFACALAQSDRIEDALRLVPPDWCLVTEHGSDLGDRIESVRKDVGGKSVVILGSDSPTIPHKRILEAFDALEVASSSEHDAAVVGPTTDGGYYLIALNRAQPALLSSIPWSTGEVMEATRRAARDAGIRLIELPLGYDIDSVEDFAPALADAVQGESARTAEALRAAIRELGMGSRRR